MRTHRSASGVPAVVVALLVVTATAASGLGGLAVGFLLGTPPAPAGVTGVTPEPTRPTMTRDEFRKAVMGKTTDEVIAAVGRPDKTQDAGGVFWYYDKRTRDPVSGAVDTHVQVVFQNGRVVEANY